MSCWKISGGKRVLTAAVCLPLIAGALIAAAVPGVSAGLAGGGRNDLGKTPQSLSQAFREAAKAVQPSVVMIQCGPAMPIKAEEPMPWGKGRSEEKEFGNDPKLFGGPLGSMPDLRRFFRDVPQVPRRAPGGLGTGLIIDKSGLILTNSHVVRGGGEITVRLHDGRELKGVGIQMDPKTDLAILRVEGAEDLKAAKLGDSDRVEVGDWVLALGHPFGLEGTLTAGIVSAKGRGIGIAERENFIQTDAAINPGNSGGPLLNLEGEVIGINTAISSNSGGSEGVGFAIPINLAKWVTGQLAQDGTVHRARLGVMVQALTHDLAQQFGVKAREGVLVGEATPSSPGAKSGLRAGDVILEFAGKKVATPQELQAVVEQSPIGQAQSIVILRDGKRMTLNVSPSEQPDVAEGGGSRGEQGTRSPHLDKLGMEIQTLTAEVAEQLQIEAEQGVVITEVRSGGPAERAGLQPGTVILQVNRKPVKTVGEFCAALDEKSVARGVLLLVRGSQGSRFVVIRV